MSDTLSFTDLDAQHVELLPARRVLSLMLTSGGGGGGTGAGGGGGAGGTAIAVNAGNVSNVGNVNVGSGNQVFQGGQTNNAIAAANGGRGGRGFNVCAVTAFACNSRR
ncbi:MAG: hypothetical protein ACRDRG_13765 [Pseudonocardiaceae bacterium]